MKGFLYHIMIDPLLSSLRSEIVKQSGNTGKVIDIACGPGSLAIDFAKRGFDVKGIDLDSDLISYAKSRAEKNYIKNIVFEVRDAAFLSDHQPKEFDIAVTSMAVHQFEADLAIKILAEMKRIATTVIIADYNFPLPKKFSGKASYTIEWIAGGEHYKNFRNYISLGGSDYFIKASGLTKINSSLKGDGAFVIAVCR